MGYDFEGYKRLTHRFRQGWASEDEHEHVGRFRVLNVRHQAPSDHEAEYGSGGQSFITVRAPRAVSADIVAQVLRDNFATGCRCEHDCCGHTSSYPGTPVRVKQRRWVVPVQLRQNI
ncbi:MULTISPECIES: hypothetical protein [unclassified Variovorax]|uniref:hypothetical protein n=1 Tax=unclassified Variovorax TaxID=663243 RepID=UPI0008398066|nr:MULTISPECIES: hypothetical protein [unclassified Variovorax]PNG49947.1 hypothetical protein CHC06_05528 [Variovorax sp. B2]PNG50819.1 hypothetical protein CHC07_05433 [Variovorax sp. B4]VTU41863.1 hypothetical protein H6P1_00061 [Variovorax sp. PBL-H6]VTU44475.1 hypothetical protein SRS16P1_00841 [Variovorax sp. SRS16]VTU44520.1 hypothetical protein E5P1_00834 [Variovorax sp. PBL-E5]